GVQQWLQLYNGGATGDDDLSDMVVDGSGNVYVTGGSDLDSAATDNVDYVTIKYNSAGVKQWSTNYNGAADKSDIAYAVAVDATGKVYVTGQADEGSPQSDNNDIVTIVYNADGSQAQVLPYAGAASGTDAGSVVLLDNATLYVAGYATYSATAQKDMVTIKYAAPDGIETTKVNALNVYPNPCAVGSSLVVPGDGNAILTVYNYTGARVLEQAVVNTAVINISHLPAGIYMAERQSNNQRAIAKFVVQ
ncbi:MAG TPA: T9SS type A sorting domain-containing protein, partial [Chitinophagales bacterium]|nr:T9SS type A sorting domain-containing protein [Chitinophagales bacterium]